MDGLAPSAIERPSSVEAVAQVVRAAADAGRAIIPWGAGTKQGLGNVPSAYDVALDLSALDQIVEYEAADLVVTAQPAIPLARLQARLREAGQFLALDPPYADRATLGGTLAANFSGPSRLLYGTARDLVLGMKVALPNGNLVKSGGRVVKNVVGYDLNKLHIGGLGTAGVMVEVTLKVHPLPPAEASVAASFTELAAAHAAALRIVGSVLYPRAVDLVRAPLPQFQNAGGWRVLVWTSGSPATVERQVRDAMAWCHEGGASEVRRLDAETHAALWSSVREFGRGGDAVLAKLTCLPSDVAELASTVERHVGQPVEAVARAGNGVLYVALPEDVSADTIGKITQEAIQRGGSAVIEQAPPALKQQIDVWGPTRGDFGLMQALKAQYDPKGTLNPGRFVGRI